MSLSVLCVSGRFRSTSVARVLLSCVGILLISASLFAQSNQGRIQGTVRDQSGGIIAGATVTVTDALKGVTRTLTTDEAGEYSAPNLDPSIYRLRVEYKGFKTFDREGLNLGVGQEAKIDVIMQTGEQNQTVTVTEAIPIVETTSATLTGNIESREDRRPPAEWPQLRKLAHTAPRIRQFARRRRRQPVRHGYAPRRQHVPDRRPEHL